MPCPAPPTSCLWALACLVEHEAWDDAHGHELLEQQLAGIGHVHLHVGGDGRRDEQGLSATCTVPGILKTAVPGQGAYAAGLPQS